jgi:hypothetical protein
MKLIMARISGSRMLFEKMIVLQLVKKLSAIWNLKVYYFVHKG